MFESIQVTLRCVLSLVQIPAWGANSSSNLICRRCASLDLPCSGTIRQGFQTVGGLGGKGKFLSKVTMLLVWRRSLRAKIATVEEAYQSWINKILIPRKSVQT